MLNQKTNQKKLIHIVLLVLICIGIFAGIGITTSIASADTNNSGTYVDTVYVDNTPWPKDWMHKIYRTNNMNTYMKENASGWIKKDPENKIQVQCSESVTGTISYSISGTSKVDSSTVRGAVSASGSLTQTLSYSYSTTTMRAFTWTVSPTDKGNYFCIAVNYKTRDYNIDHYLQEFKWFGQGPYNYYSTTTVAIPTETYLAKNYRYEIDGDIYEK